MFHRQNFVFINGNNFSQRNFYFYRQKNIVGKSEKSSSVGKMVPLFGGLGKIDYDWFSGGKFEIGRGMRNSERRTRWLNMRCSKKVSMLQTI